MSPEEINSTGAMARQDEDTSKMPGESQTMPESKPRKRRGRKKKIQLPVEPAIIQKVSRRKEYVNHTYRDYSRVPPDEDWNAPSSISEMSFSEQVHDMLSKQDEYGKLISWQPHGRSFHILIPAQFEKIVCPIYFGHKRYSSFLRQLNNHGFKHISKGPNRNSFYHECFLRGLPHLCRYMPEPKDARRQIPDPDKEPNFEQITAQYPLPIATTTLPGAATHSIPQNLSNITSETGAIAQNLLPATAAIPRSSQATTEAVENTSTKHSLNLHTPHISMSTNPPASLQQQQQNLQGSSIMTHNTSFAQNIQAQLGQYNQGSIPVSLPQYPQMKAEMDRITSIEEIRRLQEQLNIPAQSNSSLDHRQAQLSIPTQRMGMDRRAAIEEIDNLRAQLTQRIAPSSSSSSSLYTQRSGMDRSSAIAEINELRAHLSFSCSSIEEARPAKRQATIANVTGNNPMPPTAPVAQMPQPFPRGRGVSQVEALLQRSAIVSAIRRQQEQREQQRSFQETQHHLENFQQSLQAHHQHQTARDLQKQQAMQELATLRQALLEDNGSSNNVNTNTQRLLSNPSNNVSDHATSNNNNSAMETLRNTIRQERARQLANNDSDTANSSFSDYLRRNSQFG